MTEVYKILQGICYYN